MRDWLVFAIVIVLVLKTFKAPMIGVLTFAWLSLMNPHRLTYGAAYDFPFAAIISAVTLFSLLTSKEPRRFPMVPITITLMLFMAWMTATSLVALEPDLVWTEWNRVFKTFFMAFIAMFAIKSKKDIVAMAWVVGLSLAFYGVKGGIFTIVSGGSNHVYGPDGSYISDNNALALALVVRCRLSGIFNSRPAKNGCALASPASQYCAQFRRPVRTREARWLPAAPCSFLCG